MTDRVRITLQAEHSDAWIRVVWNRLLQGVTPPELAYGPECWVARPRREDVYFLPMVDGLDIGDRCGWLAIGLVWLQAPASNVRSLGLGLFKEYQGRGLGVAVRDAAFDLIFSDPAVDRLTSEVYASNLHSLGSLHTGTRARSREIRRDTAAIEVDGTWVDRIHFEATRADWEGQRVR